MNRLKTVVEVVSAQLSTEWPLQQCSPTYPVVPVGGGRIAEDTTLSDPGGETGFKTPSARGGEQMCVAGRLTSTSRRRSSEERQTRLR